MFAAKIFTLYPEFFPGLLDIGMYRRAREKKILVIRCCQY